MKAQALIQKGTTVCILGLGVTGRAALRYCLARGAKVRVSDTRDETRFLEEEGALLAQKSVEWEAGKHTLEFCSGCEVLLPSPGVNLKGELIQEIAASGAKVAGELAAVAAELDIPVIAVTGTNGKTTVTSLIGDVLKGAGKRVFVGGNIGTPLYEYCLLEDGFDYIVVEVSSFQLESSGEFAPDIGVLLNITPDHLDRHGSLDEYLRAKERIFCNQKENNLAIINGDDPVCRNVVLPSGTDVVRFGTGKENTLQITEKYFSWKLGKETQEFSHGLSGDGGFTSLNFSAAYLALKRTGLTDREIAQGFVQFQSLPHRLEFVAEKSGVLFINDSKATNTGAVIGALAEMTRPVVLIAGGKGKGEDYTLLRDSVGAQAHTIVLLGEEAASFEKSLGDIVSCIHAGSMEEAVQLARKAAKSGDVVLLSPGCASFDMFTSYGDRGDSFKNAVLALDSEMSEVAGK